MSGLERATHIDFNRDNIIGRRPDVMPGYHSGYGYPSSGYGYPSGYGYGGYSGYNGYSTGPYGFY